MKPWIDKWVNNYWFVRPWNNCSNENIMFFVSYICQKIENNPDGNPAIGLFALVQLSPINLLHKNHIIRPNLSSSNSFKVVAPRIDIIPWLLFYINLKCIKYLLCLPSAMTDCLGILWIMPKSLKLRADRKGVKLLPWNFLLSIANQGKPLITSRLTTMRTHIPVIEWTSIGHTGIDTHTIHHGMDTCEFTYLFLDQKKAWNFFCSLYTDFSEVWLHRLPYIMVCLIWTICGVQI